MRDRMVELVGVVQVELVPNAAGDARARMEKQSENVNNHMMQWSSW